MKKKGLALLLSSIGAMSLAACGGGDNGGNAADTWSVFVYMCGSDLESEYGMGTADLEEMMELADSPNVNVYVETGGSTVWQNEVSSNQLTRYKVEHGKLIELETLDNASMGEEDTLKDFLDWGKDNHSSDKDMLVMWNHGGGINGLCVDENYDGDFLTLDEFKNVMDSRDYGYELMGFDCCLMANIETLNIVKDDARYVVASEESEPGGGWAYDQFLKSIIETPDITGETVGRSICDTYYEHCRENDVDSMITLSVIETAKLEAVNKALDDYMGYVNGLVNNTEEYGEFVRSVGKSQNYGGISSEEEGFYNLFDIVDIAENVDNVPSDKKSALINSVRDAVVYCINGVGRKGANGISIFYPYVLSYDAEGLINTYGSIADSGNYSILLNNIKNENNANAVVNNTKLTIAEAPFLDDDGYYKMRFTDDTAYLLDDAVLNIYIPSEDGLIWMGSDRQVVADEETGYIQECFEGYLPMLNGEFISYYVYDAGEDYILYNVPVILNSKETTLKLMWDNTTGDGEYTILGTRNDENNEKEIIPLKAGDKLTPIYYIYGYDSDEPQIMEGYEIICTGNDVVEDVDVSLNSEYYITFVYKDIYGNTEESDLMNVQYSRIDE